MFRNFVPLAFRISGLVISGLIVGCGGTTGGDTRHTAGPADDAGRAPSGDAAPGNATQGSGGSGSGGDAGPPLAPCLNPKPLTSDGSGTGPSGGFEVCDSGVVHRPSKSDCWSVIGAPDAAEPLPLDVGSGVPRECNANDQCTGAPHGYCSVEVPERIGGIGGSPTESCHYGCVNDDECDPGSVCLCGDPVGTCVKASCTTDADCPNGLPCERVQIVPSCDDIRYEMQCGPACTHDADCVNQTGSGYGTPTCEHGTCYPGSFCS